MIFVITIILGLTLVHFSQAIQLNDSGIGVLPQQSELSKLKITLSDKCENQRKYQTEHNHLPVAKFGQANATYKFQVAGFTKNEVRVAFAGDSVAQGFGGPWIEDFNLFIQDQTDGSQQGFRGFPYLLHQLLRNNNKTTKYTFMNFAIAGGTVVNGTQDMKFDRDCRYEEFMKSMPNIVVLGFGGMDSLLMNYTEQRFIDGYVDLIQKVQAMPTKPTIMLMVPTFTCEFSHEEVDHPEPYNFFTPHSKCRRVQIIDQQSVIYNIANRTGIPDDNVVNAWKLLRLDPDVKVKEAYADLMHPAERGHGIIAQEFFMKMSLIPQIKKRIFMVSSGRDESFNHALLELTKK